MEIFPSPGCEFQQIHHLPGHHEIKALTENQIAEILIRIIDKRLLSLGTYAVDRIPYDGPGPKVSIVNIAPYGTEEEGQWTGLFTENGTAEFFDSYGHPPGEIHALLGGYVSQFPLWQYNGVMYQGPTSKVSEFYAMFFALRKMSRCNLFDITKELQSSDNSDKYVVGVVKEKYVEAVIEPIRFDMEAVLGCFRLAFGIVSSCMIILLQIIAYAAFLILSVELISSIEFGNEVFGDLKCDAYTEEPMEVD